MQNRDNGIFFVTFAISIGGFLSLWFSSETLTLKGIFYNGKEAIIIVVFVFVSLKFQFLSVLLLLRVEFQ